jgi:hypothetical protein
MHELRQRHCPTSTPTHSKNEWLPRGSLITLLPAVWYAPPDDRCA